MAAPAVAGGQRLASMIVYPARFYEEVSGADCRIWGIRTRFDDNADDSEPRPDLAGKARGRIRKSLGRPSIREALAADLKQAFEEQVASGSPTEATE